MRKILTVILATGAIMLPSVYAFAQDNTPAAQDQRLSNQKLERERTNDQVKRQDATLKADDQKYGGNSAQANAERKDIKRTDAKAKHQNVEENRTRVGIKANKKLAADGTRLNHQKLERSRTNDQLKRQDATLKADDQKYGGNSAQANAERKDIRLTDDKAKHQNLEENRTRKDSDQEKKISQ